MAEQIKYVLRGGGAEMFRNQTDHQKVLSGPSETGKSVACCLKAHMLCETIPGAQGVILRKTSASLVGSILQTYMRVAQPHIECGRVRVYGGETPTRFIYANGSTIWTAGLDNPGSVLSSERDFLYCCQVEQLTEEDWQYLITRCTGRGGVVKHPQLFSDANPSFSGHWIRKRSEAGTLKLIQSTHRDNPSLYDENGNITEQGKATMAALETLTGTLRLRLKDGVWANAEGAVYDTFNSRIHVCDDVKAEEMTCWYLGIDWGFTHPSVILLVGADYDRRWHIFREFYQCDVLPELLTAKVTEWNKEKLCQFAACDGADAGRVASLVNAGVNAIGVKKGPGSVRSGIALIKNLLALQSKDVSKRWPDGRPRLTVSSSCVNTIREFEAYRWKPSNPNHETDDPIDADNHAMDSARYIAMYLAEGGTGAFSNDSKIFVPTQVAGGTRHLHVPKFTPRRY